MAGTMSEDFTYDTVTADDGIKLAYRYTPATDTGSDLPCVVFLGGYKSDMAGSKAGYLEDRCIERGQAYLRFDYTAHGFSEGVFEECTMSRWRDDAVTIINHAAEGRDLVLVGSSMGGWAMLLTALALKDRIAGLVGIAAAPDFTEELVVANFTEEQHREMAETGMVREPSQYSDEPYIFTRVLIEDGRENLLLRGPIALDCPARMVHGMNDPDVPWQTSVRITDCLTSDDAETILIEDGDHRLSRPQDLPVIDEAIRYVTAAARGQNPDRDNGLPIARIRLPRPEDDTA